MGLDHDCINFDCAYWNLDTYVGPRTINGVECYGYMDYRDERNYWSACSVADLKSYINKQDNGFCLETLNGENNNYCTLNEMLLYRPFGIVMKYIIMSYILFR